MTKKEIQFILNSNKKKSNLLKPFSTELINLYSIYKYKFSLVELGYLYINDKKDFLCPICLNKYKFINEKEGYYNFCSIECESKREDYIVTKEVLINFLNRNNLLETYNSNTLNILKENKLLSSLIFYTKFLVESSFSERLYCLKKELNETPLCKHCNKNKVKYKNFSVGYFEYCSNSCSFNATKNNRIKTNIEKYGIINTFQVEDSINKRALKIKDPAVIKKCQETKIAKYGEKKTFIYDKVKVNWNNKTEEEIKDIENKRKKTLILLYGETYKDKITEKRLVSYKINSIKRKLLFFKELDILSDFDINLYNGIEDKKYKWFCGKCELSYYESIDNGQIPFCPKCNSNNGSSLGEIDLYQFILSLNKQYENNNRSIIKPLELDILIENKIAIEFNGLYYHSENYLNSEKQNSLFLKDKLEEFKLNKNIGKSFHLLKTKLCNLNGIQLLHINEDEWKNEYKKEIWKSIIKNKLNLLNRVIYARDCYIKEISYIDKSNFLDNNHLQGNDNSKVKIGLFLKKDKFDLNKDELVSIMTFGKSRYDKNIEVELYRFCNLINTRVIGSASKMLKYYISKYNPIDIVSYGDKRFGGINFYEKIGFKKIGETIPGFKYIKSNKTFNRELFQKHLLENYKNNNLYGIKTYNSEFTGEENMILNGYNKIYDSGNNKFYMKIK